MKTTAALLLSALATLFLPSCANDEPVTRTTTTEETIVQHPSGTTTTETHETQVRRY